MKANQINRIIDATVDRDSVHPMINYAFYQGDYWYATDGHCLIAISRVLMPKDNCMFMEQGPEVLNCYRVLNPLLKFNCIHTISRQMMSWVIKQIPDETYYKEKLVKCPECGGTGEVEFEYEAQEDGETYNTVDSCPICDGTGRIMTLDKNHPYFRKKQTTTIQIVDELIPSSNILWVAKIMNILNLAEVVIRCISDKGQILMMAMQGVYLCITPALCNLENMDDPIVLFGANGLESKDYIQSKWHVN